MGRLPRLIDARAPGLEPADVIVVFGTRYPEPAHLAADLWRRGLAPRVVVTGGSARQADGLVEAHHHRDLLVAAGVPVDAIGVEDRSTNTDENVRFALPLLGAPATAIAVVKHHHRRALVTLARHVPSVERIFAATWLAPLSDDRLAREQRHLAELEAAGVDLLAADGRGWVRTRFSEH